MAHQADNKHGRKAGTQHFFEQVFGAIQHPQAGAGAAPAPDAGWPVPAPSEQFFRFLEEIPGGFLIYRAQGDEEIVYANQGLLRIFGCETREEFRELTGNTFRGMVLAEDLDAVEASVAQQVSASHYDLDYVEYRIRRRDGQIRWVEDYGHFVRSEKLGDLFYVFLGDATEKRVRIQLEREQSLKDLIESYDKERALINREYLRRLEVIEGLSVNYESIFYIDLGEDTILPYRLSERTQPSFSARFQMQVYSLFVREYIDRWVLPEDRDLVLRTIGPGEIRTRLQGCDSCYVNYRVTTGQGLQYLQLRLASVGAEGTQVVMGCRRVDDELRREMEQKQVLAEALNNANLAMAAKSTFLSNMSHDMRTPLNAILGFAALARRSGNDPAALERYLGQIEASGKQLLELINKVLELSQSQTSSRTIAAIECDLIQAAQEVCSFLRPQAAEKGLAFSLDCGGVTHSAVYADREKLNQLILYLVNNAITYTNAGSVRITLSEHDQLPNRYAVYRLTVEDTGIGIKKDSLERIFDPFTRERSTTLSGVYGIGLGLTIVKDIVDLLGGKIEVESQPGKGSVFTVELRLRQNRPDPTDEVGQAFFRDRPCQKLLLVEDNELNREIETELLQEVGFSIETAEDGKVAVELLQAAEPGRFDLVLMDLQMPVMDGWAAARAIRALKDADKAAIPIIALSANTMPEDLRRSREAGMDAHLAKPVDVSLLMETIREVMERRSRG